MAQFFFDINIYITTYELSKATTYSPKKDWFSNPDYRYRLIIDQYLSHI